MNAAGDLEPDSNPLIVDEELRLLVNTSDSARDSAIIPSQLHNAKDSSHASKAQPFKQVLGIILLLVTVVLWTVSNFLASTLFANDSYSKPYFVTYVNSAFFSLFLIFVAIRSKIPTFHLGTGLFRSKSKSISYIPVSANNRSACGQDPSSPCLACNQGATHTTILDPSSEPSAASRLDIYATARLSLEFCVLWFLANYFIAACLEYTTVASSTILASTSSIWTLVLGAFLKIEPFTFRKLIGTLVSLAGVILISSSDLTSNNDQNRGQFPHKSHRELAIGDGLALASAILYGVYSVLMKKRIGDEARVDMPLFFGLVGLFNAWILLPGFLIVHVLGIETFALPPTKRITSIIMANSATSLISDFCWAYSMLLTSPLLVTMGLSLTIPLSLLGEMIVNDQKSSSLYWVGAVIVFLSFLFISNETMKDKHETGSKARNIMWPIRRWFGD